MVILFRNFVAFFSYRIGMKSEKRFIKYSYSLKFESFLILNHATEVQSKGVTNMVHASVQFTLLICQNRSNY